MKSVLEIKDDILQDNAKEAQGIRQRLAESGTYMVNLMASPGAGKTSTILAVVKELQQDVTFAVIEGDIESFVDSEKVKEAGVTAVQIRTGGACHLDVPMVEPALDLLDLPSTDCVFIENIGNLVCPAEFDTGACANAMILSVPEGDDKPLKYPGVFQVSEAVILNKVDTMPVFNFNQEAFEESVNRLNPQAPIFPLSATTGEGLEAWTSWLAERIRKA